MRMKMKAQLGFWVQYSAYSPRCQSLLTVSWVIHWLMNTTTRTSSLLSYKLQQNYHVSASFICFWCFFSFLAQWTYSFRFIYPRSFVFGYHITTPKNRPTMDATLRPGHHGFNPWQSQASQHPELPDSRRSCIKFGWDTLWLCQNNYWKWPLIVDFPIK